MRSRGVLIVMSLARLTENRAVAAQLSSLLASGRTVHAFLFTGPAESRKKLAEAFAKAILCGTGGDSCDVCLSCRKFDHGNHEDYLFISRTENRQSIVAAQIEELQAALQFKAFGSSRVAVIDEAHLMNPTAQNKLLKTLEEPAPGTVILLLAESRDGLLPTILSRCSCYSLTEGENAVAADAMEMARSFVSLIAADAPFYRKKECIRPILDAKEEARADALAFLDALTELCGEYIRSGGLPLEKLTLTVRTAEAASWDLRNAYNTGYVLKGMCLKL